jgi:hypothetical protein
MHCCVGVTGRGSTSPPSDPEDVSESPEVAPTSVSDSTWLPLAAAAARMAAAPVALEGKLGSQKVQPREKEAARQERHGLAVEEPSRLHASRAVRPTAEHVARPAGA